jgi:hypothetical protein
MLHKSKRSNAKAYCGWEKLLLYATMLNHQTRECSLPYNLCCHSYIVTPLKLKHGTQLFIWEFLALNFVSGNTKWTMFFLLICQTVVLNISIISLVLRFLSHHNIVFLDYELLFDIYLYPWHVFSFVSGMSFCFSQDIILIIAPYSTGNHCLEGQLSWMFSRITY